MKKRSKKYNPNRYKATSASFERAIYCATTEEAKPNDRAELMVAMYANLTLLTSGKLELENYMDMVEDNLFGTYLGLLVFNSGDAALRDVILPSEDAFYKSANALADIATRRLRINRFTPTGDELNCIKGAIEWTDQLLNISTRGLISRATLDAALRMEEFRHKFHMDPATGPTVREKMRIMYAG